jgi:hypothetical protein
LNAVAFPLDLVLIGCIHIVEAQAPLTRGEFKCGNQQHYPFMQIAQAVYSLTSPPET